MGQKVQQILLNQRKYPPIRDLTKVPKTRTDLESLEWRKAIALLEIGLTGGIGSGKSTVGAMLVGFGAVLVDADAIVRELQAPGQPVFEAMLEHWGTEILDTDGTLDRAAVAARVFTDPDELAALNLIVHPAVGVEMQSRREALAGTDATVILDIPLLVESGHRGLDGLVVVDLAPDLAKRRLVEHRGFTDAEAEQRIAAQATREERLEVGDLVINNNGPIGDLSAEVDRCWEWIMGLDRPPLDRPLEKLSSRLDPE